MYIETPPSIKFKKIILKKYMLFIEIHFVGRFYVCCRLSGENSTVKCKFVLLKRFICLHQLTFINYPKVLIYMQLQACIQINHFFFFNKEMLNMNESGRS